MIIIFLFIKFSPQPPPSDLCTGVPKNALLDIVALKLVQLLKFWTSLKSMDNFRSIDINQRYVAKKIVPCLLLHCLKERFFGTPCMVFTIFLEPQVFKIRFELLPCFRIRSQFNFGRKLQTRNISHPVLPSPSTLLHQLQGIQFVTNL